MEIAKKLEVHYYLANESHSMDVTDRRNGATDVRRNGATNSS